MDADSTFGILELSIRVALFATLFGVGPAILVGYWLARAQFSGKSLVSAVTALPLITPPTAMGYLLLQLLAIDGPLGRRALGFDLGVLMTWRGAVLAACVMSFPLIVRTARVAFEAVDPRLAEVGQSLGYGAAQTFIRFTLPAARRGIIAGAILGFTRALGEFGATVTLAGNIPGQTSTLAAAIWSAQEMGDHASARVLIMVAMGIGLCASVVAERLARPWSEPSAPAVRSDYGLLLGRGA